LDNHKFTSVSQQNQVINAIRFLYKFGLNKKYDKVSFKRPKSEKKLPQVIDHNHIITQLNKIENLKHKAILSLAYSVGLRVSEIINLKNVSHAIKDIWWDGDNIMGKIEILPTPSGNILKALIESNISVGVSSRGMGTLKQTGDLMEVQDDFTLTCWDFVSTPSNPGSWMHPVKGTMNESLQSSKLNKYSKVNSILYEILCAHGTCPII
jgi:hypothetical protein